MGNFLPKLRARWASSSRGYMAGGVFFCLTPICPPFLRLYRGMMRFIEKSLPFEVVSLYLGKSSMMGVTMRTMTVISILIMGLILPPQVQGETLCWVKGTVKGEEGKPLAYANVFLKGRIEGAMSDEQGNFTFSTRAEGRFTLVCSYIGYQTYEKEIVLRPGKTVRLSICLKTKIIKGKPITITASSFTSADREGVTLSSLDVVTTPGAAADVLWAIKTFPGVAQVEEGAGMFVRGGDVGETVMLLDGAILTHPYRYESPTGGFFGTISPFLLKGTYFSSGGFSARYGNALSGALAMESKDLPAKMGITLGLGLAAESAALALPLIPQKLGFSSSGNISATRAMFKLNNCSEKFTQYPYAHDLNFNLMYRYSTTGYLKLFLFQEMDKIGVEMKNPQYGGFYKGKSLNCLYNLKFSDLFVHKLFLQGNLAFTNFEQSSHLNRLDLNSQDRLGQFRLSGEYEAGSDLTLRGGISYLSRRVLCSGTVPQEEADLNPNAPVDIVDTHYRSRLADGFIEGEFYSLLGRFVPGLRGEYESNSSEFTLDPRLSLMFPLGLHSGLTAAWGVYHQYPDPQYYDPNIGNPHLTAMEATHTIMGYEYHQGNQILRIEAYSKRYRNLLLEDSTNNYTNDGYGYARGVDLFVKRSFKSASGWLSYGYLKSRRRWKGFPDLRPPYFDITHNLTLVTKFRLAPRLGLGATYRYATGKPYTPAPGQYHTKRVPDYRKMDVNLSYLCSLFEGNLTVFYLAISNLLGRVNIFDYRYSPDYRKREPVKSSFRRSVYFGVSLSI